MLMVEAAYQLAIRRSLRLNAVVDTVLLGNANSIAIARLVLIRVPV